MLLQQRDDLLNQISNAEDRENKNQAALTNLQCALELFQKGKNLKISCFLRLSENNVSFILIQILDKEHDVELQTKKLQRELEEAKKKEQVLHQNINLIQQQLNEAKQGLLAATRLNDQLEMNQATIEKLRAESKIFQHFFACWDFWDFLFQFHFSPH